MATESTTQGLEGIVLTSTRLSQIDGEHGQLRYVGYDIHELAAQAQFEEICWLLWHGELPSRSELQEFRARLAMEYQLSSTEQALVDGLPSVGHGMDALRTLASGLAQLDPQADATDPAAVERIGYRLIGKLPALLSAWDRRRRGLPSASADAQQSHAANILLMLHGQQPSAAAVQALNTYMVLLAEHGLNASTFAARVAISAHTDVYAAIVAAIGTLKGLLHGGANQKAMESFIAIGSPERAASYIEELLAHHGRLMGVGHRIYKVADPRAGHLRQQLELLEGPHGRWGSIADRVAAIVAEHPYFVARQLNPNVEFGSAPLLGALGISLDLFTAMFAFSRTAGWIAHIREQLAENRIIRPKADYHGPRERHFDPLERRN
jgi:citrate synthase